MTEIKTPQIIFQVELTLDEVILIRDLTRNYILTEDISDESMQVI